jgi:hypothetical protein
MADRTLALYRTLAVRTAHPVHHGAEP